MAHLISLFEQHNYFILFLGVFLELMALPISAEILMSYAGFFVYQGKMNYVLALLTVFGSAGSGITVTYWIGRKGGYKLIENYGKYIHLGPERYDKIAAWFERSGRFLLIFAYFIPGIRHFTGYVSGISKMPFRKFLFSAYTGAILWGVCFVTLGKVLGPKWEVFHKSASRYLIVLIMILAVLGIGVIIYLLYKNQIKGFIVRLLRVLLDRFKTIRATEVFLILLTLAFIGLVSLMLGLAQDYLYNELTQFNDMTEYMAQSVLYSRWMKSLLHLTSPYTFVALIVMTLICIWRRDQDRLLEYLLLIVTITGAWLYHESIKQIFSFLQSLGFFAKYHSDNFPDFNATITIIIYGACLFLLVRYPKRALTPILVLLFAIVLFFGVAISRIATTDILPSDLAGGYIYGGVWIFFNFLLFEMLRLVIPPKK